MPVQGSLLPQSTLSSRACRREDMPTVSLTSCLTCWLVTCWQGSSKNFPPACRIEGGLNVKKTTWKTWCRYFGANPAFIMEDQISFCLILASKTRHWLPANLKGSKIETTGYALLAQLALGRLHYAGPIVTWLTAMQNAQGAFQSTHVSSSVSLITMAMIVLPPSFSGHWLRQYPPDLKDMFI